MLGARLETAGQDVTQGLWLVPPLHGGLLLSLVQQLIILGC
jgi:hypothetical protein